MLREILRRIERRNRPQKRESAKTVVLALSTFLIFAEVNSLALIAEQQRRQFVQAATPRQEFVRGVRRDISGVLNSDRLKSIMIGVDVRGLFAAATAGEDNFHLLFEARRVHDVIRGNNATAEEADV